MHIHTQNILLAQGYPIIIPSYPKRSPSHSNRIKACQSLPPDKVGRKQHACLPSYQPINPITQPTVNTRNLLSLCWPGGLEKDNRCPELEPGPEFNVNSYNLESLKYQLLIRWGPCIYICYHLLLRYPASRWPWFRCMENDAWGAINDNVIKI